MTNLQELCEQGQDALMKMRYLQAEQILRGAEAIAMEQRDFDTLSRLYMPLQECRRQRRQRCGEGAVRFDLVESENQPIDVEKLLGEIPQGQLMVAGWGSIRPALQLRRLVDERDLYVETFLGAAYPILGGGQAIAVVPNDEVALPTPEPRTIDALLGKLPAHSVILSEADAPPNLAFGTYASYGQVMALWERLHAPFLAAADMQVDPVRKIEGYRKTIAVDYACELAHQKLSGAARQLAARK